MNPSILEEFFGIKYFKVNKFLLEFSGLWPYQTWIRKIVIRVAVLFLLVVPLIPNMNAVRIHCPWNMRLCSENACGVLFVLGCGTKYLVTFLSEKSMQRLYEEVTKTWVSITDPVEKAIMENYAKISYWKTIAYVGYMASTGVYFSQIGLTPLLLDFIMPLNESREKMLVVNGEFFIDPYEYYYELYVMYSFTAFASVITFTAIDTTYTMVVHQVIGIINVVKYRVRIATQNPDAESDFAYKTIRSSIELHAESLKFVNLVESTYRLCFLVLIGLCVPYLAFGAILVCIQKHQILHSWN
ncbi:hypothetical protein QAD02_006130 [Eretmocerus hayati]|uniref:Uncharacterized protein n=1 Tax=Eretmocerus hayati TaxID=131215 RepID=A0ACC2N0I3_9HYME|nr:hypothetical protein QAD02_006130 [Eretmocerus hayati]